jgi:hypothetical protein
MSSPVTGYGARWGARGQSVGALVRKGRHNEAAWGLGPGRECAGGLPGSGALQWEQSESLGAVCPAW